MVAASRVEALFRWLKPVGFEVAQSGLQLLLGNRCVLRCTLRVRSTTATMAAPLPSAESRSSTAW